MTILHVTVIPKRMLTRREAAGHCGRSLRQFELECPVAPIVFANGDVRFDLRELDAWIDGLKSDVDNAEGIIARLGR